MQVEEEAMTEEEYEAELAAQEAAKTANVKEEEDILTPQEAKQVRTRRCIAAATTTGLSTATSTSTLTPFPPRHRTR